MDNSQGKHLEAKKAYKYLKARGKIPSAWPESHTLDIYFDVPSTDEYGRLFTHNHYPDDVPAIAPDAKPDDCETIGVLWGSDQLRCPVCGIVWDTDENKPTCQKGE